MIQVLQLGLIDYEAGLKLQQSLVELRKQVAIADTLLLLEHPPVITLGRNAKAANILATVETLKQKGIAIFECDRGGDVTFHGPGQLVGYPIFDLRGFTDAQGNCKTLGVLEYVRKLEEVIIRTCGDLGIPAVRIPGLTGVWTEDLSPRRRKGAEENQFKKIAAIGVHISRGVTSHGFALNVNDDLQFFKLIVPCGISDKPVTSMDQELRALGAAPPQMEKVAHAVSRNFGRVFQRQIVWLQSLEDAMRSGSAAPQDTPARPPKELRQMRGDETYLA